MSVHLVSGYVPLTVTHRSEEEYYRLGENLHSLHVESSIFFDTIEDCWMHHAIKGKGYEPRHAHDLGKNTMEYHIVQHQKTTWMLRAALANPKDDVFVWMDYGIFHMPGFTQEKVLAFLQECEHETAIAIPGAWPKGQEGGPCWRFNGSILVCHRDYLAALDQRVRELAVFYAKYTKTVIWEVNTWDRVESEGELPIRWYGATHDETMLTSYRRP